MDCPVERRRINWDLIRGRHFETPTYNEIFPENEHSYFATRLLLKALDRATLFDFEETATTWIEHRNGMKYRLNTKYRPSWNFDLRLSRFKKTGSTREHDITRLSKKMFEWRSNPKSRRQWRRTPQRIIILHYYITSSLIYRVVRQKFFQSIIH